MRQSSSPRVLLALVVGGLASSRAGAQSSVPTLRQLHHTAWTLRDGAPSDIDALAQSADGFLWLGTTTGLFRFDGVRFERYERPGQPLPSNNVSTLLALPDSSLWIGYRFGGVSVLTRRRLVSYGVAEGCPSGTTEGIARDSTGRMWIATSNGLMRLQGGRCKLVGPESGFPGGIVSSLHVDRRGTLWVAAAADVFALPRAAATFMRRAPSIGYGDPGSLAEAADGSIWGASIDRGPILLATATGMRPAQGVARRSFAANLLIASDSSLWVSATNTLERSMLSQAQDLHGGSESRQHMARLEGLSGNTVEAMLEDREHDVWIGTEGGLDRFRVAKLTTIAVPRNLLGPSIVAGAHRTLWAGSLVTPMMRITDVATEMPGTPTAIESASQAPDSSIWVSGKGMLFHSHGSTFEQVPPPAGASGAHLQAIAQDRAGALWISVVRKGVFRRTGSEWIRMGASWGLDATTAITIVADTAGPVWLGYTGSRVVRVDGDSAQMFSAAQGLDVGNATALLPRGRETWVGGERGLACITRGRAIPILTEGDRALRGVSGIVERAGGELWLNGADGVTRIPAAEVAHALRDTSYRVRVERLDYRDGLDGIAPQIRPLPTAVEGPDGRIWLATSSNILWVDPRSIHRNSLAPPISITALDADGHVYSTDSTVVLPRRTTAMHIQFTALSLTIPERVRFRYKLDGLDDAWQDGGTRREVFFTNLGPGTYRFHVMASNDDGVWSRSDDALTVVIPPTFIQTRTFAALCVLLAAATLWLLFQLRQRRVLQAVRARFDVTLAERTRIAQELHDTLLQSFMGITLQLHGVERMMGTRPAEATTLLSRAIGQAQAAVHDARHAVWDMRSPELDGLGLAEALTEAARTAIGERPIGLQMDVRGSRRTLSRDVESVVLRVSREAIVNAVKHSGARAIEVHLIYEEESLRLKVHDDGCGFSPATADHARAGGHWGIVGMRERADAVGGSITIESVEGEGTTITLWIPTGARATGMDR